MKKRISKEAAFALAMSAIFSVSMSELGNAYESFMNDFYQEDRV